MFVNNKYSIAVGAPITCTTKPPIRILLWMDTCGHNNTATTVHLHINIVVRLHGYKLYIYLSVWMRCSRKDLQRTISETIRKL